MNYLRYCLGLALAYMLSILAIPYGLSAFRPPWVLLLLLYIRYFIPSRMGVVSLLWFGLLLDVLLSTVLGEHALALIIVFWLAATRSRRFPLFSLLHQMLTVGFLCFCYQTIIVLINMLLDFNYSLYTPVISAFVGLLFWPSIRVFGELFLNPPAKTLDIY
jgi:rod shape-determining protein MreD